MDIVYAGIDFLGLQRPSPKTLSLLWTSFALVITAPLVVLFHLNSRPRHQVIPVYRERVVILGASNPKGVGEALALEYAGRGCRDLVLVARNLEGLKQVQAKCIEAARKSDEWNQSDANPGEAQKLDPASRVHIFQADCTDAADVDRLRKFVTAKLKGLDTLHICFGVSALHPLLGVAGVDPVRTPKGGLKTVYADQAGLKAVGEAVSKASDVNVTGTAICLAAFVPMLQTTSFSPAVALTSSAAALLPPPTRSIYGATKSAQLTLFKAFGIECQAHHELTRNSDQRRKLVRFLAVCPGTIATSFRHSAVDLEKPGEEGKAEMPEDLAWVKGEKMLTPESVAGKTIFAVDRKQQGTITMPGLYAAAVWIEKIL